MSDYEDSMSQRVSDEELNNTILDSRFGSKLKIAIDLHNLRQRVREVVEDVESRYKHGDGGENSNLSKLKQALVGCDHERL